MLKEREHMPDGREKGKYTGWSERKKLLTGRKRKHMQVQGWEHRCRGEWDACCQREEVAPAGWKGLIPSSEAEGAVRRGLGVGGRCGRVGATLCFSHSCWAGFQEPSAL